MLATLEEQLRSAETHEQKMRAALVESELWALADDRDWIKEAVAEAEQMRADAKARLEQGRRIVARTVKETPRG